jgi:hypothetical protein
MNMNKLIIPSLLALVAMHSSACDLSVPDLNNPGLSDLERNPTRALVSATATGLLFGHRANVAAANGYISQLGILGREAYNFDGADPRLINELLAGELQRSSPFGGGTWALPYANIRQANLLIAALDKVVVLPFPDTEKSAVRGFAHTMMALDLLRIIVTRDSIGAVIDTETAFDPEVEIGPMVPKEQVYQRIAELLDTAKAELMAGGTLFPFPLTTGFTGFDTPAAFLKVNRAFRARAALYSGSVGSSAEVLTALGESFINAAATTPEAFDVGPTLVYSANTGDAVNGLTNPNIFAHPKLLSEAQKNGAVVDDRVTRKITTVPNDEAGTGQGLSSNLKFTLYSRTGPVPLIRNEELILMRAEAEAKLSMTTQAIADLNIVRTGSGKLLPLVLPLTEAEVTAEILYNRRYSLMFEGGHRWIDIRRFGITAIPGELEKLLDKPDHKFNLRYPIPQGECDARPGELACTMGSL